MTAENINFITFGLFVVGASLCGLLTMMIKMRGMIRELRHDLNGRLEEMKQQMHTIGTLEGAQQEREASRLIAKDLIRDSAQQSQASTTVPTNDVLETNRPSKPAANELGGT